jgi:MFS family permease
MSFGNLAALLAFGRLSDRVARRRTTLSAIGIAIVSALIARSSPLPAVADFGAVIYTKPVIPLPGAYSSSLLSWL